NLARTRRRIEHHHDHDGEHHHHHDHRPSRRSLVTLGFVGGMVPSPSALVVLLGALALHRAWFGVLLVLGYGVGMAIVLVGAGLLLVRGGRLLARVGALRPPSVARVAGRVAAMSVRGGAGAGLVGVARRVGGV